MTGGLNPSIFGQKWRRPEAETHENARLQSDVPKQGRLVPIVRELALGAAPLAPGAQDRTTGMLFRVRVLGGSRVGVLCDRFEVFFCCFHLLFYWNIIGFVET